jgi:signal transduction histidine kinase
VRNSGDMRAAAVPGDDPWPSWARVAESVFALALAAVALALDPYGATTAGFAALLLAAVAPWLLQLTGITLPPLVFALAALVPLAVLNIGGEQLGVSLRGDGPQLSFMLLIFAVTCTAARASLPVTGLVTVLGLGIVGGRALVAPFHSWIFWAVGLLLSLFAGLAMRAQRLALAELSATQAALANEVASQERQRIAREIHDIVAHTLTVTMLHLTAARMALQRGGDDASEALAEAERLGRQSLADLRRTVGLLRSGDDGPVARPLPTVAELEALVAGYAAAGLPVTLTVDGPTQACSFALGLAIYRIVQESLANVVKHTPGARASVTLTVGADAVTLRVHSEGGRPSDKPLPTGAGSGLIGMRERATLLHGTLHAGPVDGGWLVECVLPRPRADVLAAS